MRHDLPERRQRVDRIEHAGQKRQRHDDEILKRRELIEFVGPNAGDQSQDAEDRAPKDHERERPQRMR